jgi:homoserine kinase
MASAVTVSCPGSIANLVCGFDILGLALNNPQDIMHMKLAEKPGVFIRHSDGYNLPTAPEKNVAGAALLALLEEYPTPTGFEVVIDKRIKPGSGLGSSAASAAGAVAGANHLLGHHFSKP